MYHKALLNVKLHFAQRCSRIGRGGERRLPAGLLRLGGVARRDEAALEGRQLTHRPGLGKDEAFLKRADELPPEILEALEHWSCSILWIERQDGLSLRKRVLEIARRAGAVERRPGSGYMTP